MKTNTVTVDQILAQNRQLKKEVESKAAYILVLEEQCRIANELIKELKHNDSVKTF
jgi:hypothetical protein